MSEAKPCILRLYKVCKPSLTVKNVEFGSLDWIANVCAFCIKATYAHSHKPSRRPRPNKYSIVNTL